MVKGRADAKSQPEESHHEEEVKGASSCSTKICTDLNKPTHRVAWFKSRPGRVTPVRDLGLSEKLSKRA